MSDTTTSKTRTITLSDRPPVKIKEDEWPITATGSAGDDDSDGRGNQPNRKWTRTIRVRQHEDGRAIVYGVYEYDSAFQGKRGAFAKRGTLLTAPVTSDQIIAAIQSVAGQLSLAESMAAVGADWKDPNAWTAAAHECIADLPAETL
jgi:hypothetical protein